MKITKSIMIFATVMISVAALLSGCVKSNDSPAEKELDFENTVFSEYKVFEAPMKSLRAMAVSADGNYFYTGHIALRSNGVRKLDAATGEFLWAYHDASGAQNPDSYREYPKGIAVDDRGYVYAMITYTNMTGATLAILNDSDGTEVSSTFVDFGQIDAGANGIAVKRDGDGYYAYFISNYGPNRIYCYDVTDPSAPVLNTEFGADGYVSLARKTGVADADANCIAVADNGDIYVTIKLAAGSKADSVGRFSCDGRTFEKVIDCDEAYGISIAEGYIFVSTYEGEMSAVKIYKLSDYSLAATLAADVEGHSHYSQVLFSGSRIYAADQSYQTGATAEELGSRILVSGEIGEKLHK